MFMWEYYYYMRMCLILERRRAFETKRKGHYREWHAVQMARRLLEQDELEEDEDEDAEGKTNEETSSEEENNFDARFKCMPSCDRSEKK